MNARLTSLAAVVTLTLGATFPVLAQSYNAPAGIAAATAPAGLEGRAGRFNAEAARQGLYADDDVTTGSIVSRRGFDSSAKAGNAEGNNRVVPNYGTTSGGPAY